MKSSVEFPVFFKRKILYVSEGILGICAVFSCMLTLPFFFTEITGNRVGVIAADLYFLLMPGWLIVLCLIGAVFFGILYSISRIKQPAVLNASAGMLHIKGIGIDLSIPVQRIKKIYFNDLKNMFREPKGVMQIVVKQENGQHTFLMLADYGDIEKAMDMLGKIGTVEFAFYDDSMEAMGLDE